MANIQETKISHLTSSSKTIYGYLASTQENNSLVIFVHGFTGTINEPKFYNMRKHCLDAGMDCLRWRLYGIQDDARSLRTCTLDDHVYDLNLLIDIYSKAYEHIYLV